MDNGAGNARLGDYAGTTARLDWLRTGSGDGSGARMLLPGNYLPLAGQRGDVAAAPPMVTQGMLAGQPQNAQVSGDV
jgi:hypothetical protein